MMPSLLGRNKAPSCRRYGWHRLVVVMMVATVFGSNLSALCEAFSSNLNSKSKPKASSSSSSSLSMTIDGISVKLFDPSDETTLALLRDCRRTAFDASKQNFLDSERDFVAARSAAEGKNLCAVALDKTGTVVGSADLCPKERGNGNVVTNVFVRPDRRGSGIGELLMVEGIEGILASNLPEKNKISAAANKGDGNGNGNRNSEAILSLDVYTQNKPAFALYQKLGYEPSSPVHSGTLALANALGTNLVVSLSKTVPVQEK